MGTSIFIGYTISSLAFPRMADVYGRKIVFNTFFLFHILGTVAILFTPTYYGIYLGLFMVGLASTIRTVVAYVYSLEFVENRN
jgi:MFS family permease